MAELLYPTSIEVDGPWLVSAAQLEALDQIVDKEMVSLKDSLEKRRSRDLEERMADRLKRGLTYTEEEKAKFFRDSRAEQLNYSSYQVRREVRLALADERRVSSETFREAASHPEIEFSRIVGFMMELGNG